VFENLRVNGRSGFSWAGILISAPRYISDPWLVWFLGVFGLYLANVTFKIPWASMLQSNPWRAILSPNTQYFRWVDQT